MVAANGFDETHLLKLAASLERASEHPLAAAIVAGAQERQIELLNVDNFQSVTGKGVTGSVNNQSVGLGNHKLMQQLGVAGLMINCTPSRTIRWPLAELRVAAPGTPLGAYANIGHTDDIVGWTDTGDVSPTEYAGLGLDWLGLGARLVGGCCGTRPAHIAALRAALDRAP